MTAMLALNQSPMNRSPNIDTSFSSSFSSSSSSSSSTKSTVLSNTSLTTFKAARQQTELMAEDNQHQFVENQWKMSHESNDDSQLTIDVMDLSPAINTMDRNNNNNNREESNKTKCNQINDSNDSPGVTRIDTSLDNHHHHHQQSPKLNFGMESILNRHFDEELEVSGSNSKNRINNDGCSSPVTLTAAVAYCAATSRFAIAASIERSSNVADTSKPPSSSPFSPTSAFSSSSSLSSISSSPSLNLCTASGVPPPPSLPLYRTSSTANQQETSLDLPTLISGIASESNSAHHNTDNSIMLNAKANRCLPAESVTSIPAAPSISRPVFFNQSHPHLPATHQFQQASECFYSNSQPNAINNCNSFGATHSWPLFPFFESKPSSNGSAFSSNIRDDNKTSSSSVSTIASQSPSMAAIPFHSLFSNFDGFYDPSTYFPRQPHQMAANDKMAENVSTLPPSSSSSASPTTGPFLNNFQSNSSLAAAAAAYNNMLPYSTLMSYLNCANLNYYNSNINNNISNNNHNQNHSQTNLAESVTKNLPLNGAKFSVPNHPNGKTMNGRPFGERSATGSNNSIREKKKRSWSRAVFSSLQRRGLEKRFLVQRYITKPDRRHLAASLGLTDAQVKVWFQNRRMKWRHSLPYSKEVPLIEALHRKELQTLIQKSTLVMCPTVATATAAASVVSKASEVTTTKLGRQSSMPPGSSSSTAAFSTNQNYNNCNNKQQLQTNNNNK